MRFGKSILVGLMVVSLATVAACQSSDDSSTDTGPKSLISQIKQSGELRVGFASAQPWQFKDPTSGEWQGVFVDVMADWAKTLDVKFVPVATTWDNIIAGLQAGQYDVGILTECTTRSIDCRLLQQPTRERYRLLLRDPRHVGYYNVRNSSTRLQRRSVSSRAPPRTCR